MPNIAEIRCAAAVVGLFLTAAPACAFQNEPTGFRGIEWGMPFSAAPGVFFTAEQVGDRISYRRSLENLTLNGIPLEYIWYNFYKGRFEEAVIVASRSHAPEMMQTFASRYGTPERREQRKDRFLWSGETATIDLNCSGRYSTCTAVIASNAMVAAEQAGQAAAAPTADKDF